MTKSHLPKVAKLESFSKAVFNFGDFGNTGNFGNGAGSR
jgi:hypothetical protein